MIIKKCEICGKSMECKRLDKKYCSKTCANKASDNRKRNGQSLERECPICGLTFTPKTVSANLRKCCYNCHKEGEVLTRGKILDLIRGLYGSRCAICGYSKYTGALEFHHRDPNEKDFTISNDRAKLEESIEESKKCILLCANCHREVHAGLAKISEVE